MIGLISAVLVASLLGSMHCAGMCGAFLAFALDAGDQPSTPRWSLQAAYHLGRLTTYLVMGVMGGLLGAAVDISGSMIGLQRSAAVIAGGLMMAFGVLALLRIVGVRTWHAPIPARWQRLLAAAHQRAFDLPPVRRALLIGLLTTLLPCGWLYAFVITAAGTANPALAAITMFVFWLGTLPVLAGLGLGVQKLTGAMRKRLPVATSILIVAVGMYTVLGRMHIPAMAASQPTAKPGDSAIESATENVRQIDQESLPCCHDR